MTSLRLLSARVRVDLVGVECLPATVTERVRGVLAQLVVTASGSDGGRSPRRTVSITNHEDIPHLGHTPLPEDPDFAAAAIVAALDRALLAATSCLTIHAAVVAGPRGAAIIPAVSGAGKSTLAGASQQAGLLLVSDEAACLDPDQDVIWPHPRPLGLDLRSRELLGLRPPDDGPGDGERATSPGLLGAVASVAEPVVPVAVVLPDRSDASSASLTPVGRAEALAVLLASCLNIGPQREWYAERAWSRLTSLARDLACYRMEYGSPQGGAATLADLLTYAVDGLAGHYSRATFAKNAFRPARPPAG
jgi:hypothetical protein